MELFNATKKALKVGGQNYADYIQGKLEHYVAIGHYTLEYATSVDLGTFLMGNDGD